MFVDPQRVGFAAWVREHLAGSNAESGSESGSGSPRGPDGFVLQAHQRVIARFLRGSPYRGLLLYHGLGSGKSCAAIAAAEAVGRANLFVMLPASLRPNFEAEIAKCGRGLAARITWVSTNGTPAGRVSRTRILGTPVEGSCIVIDEVHNFISQVVNGGKRGTALFDAIFHARDVKLVFLSGTPIINKPFEVGTLLNLLNGPVVSHVFQLRGVDEKAASALLRASEWVDRFEFRGKKAVVSLTPFPFRRAADGFSLVEDEAMKKLGEQAVVREVWDALGTGDYRTEKQYTYPDREDAFNRAFLNGDLTRFVNADQFKRLALGKVSYFRMSAAAASAAGLPRVVENPPVLLEMSGTQFESYIAQRTVEIQLEMRLRDARRARTDQIATGVFRAFSRAVCNFAFDNESPIRRYFPSTYKAMVKEMDTPDAARGDGEGGDAAAAAASLPTYEQMLRATMDALGSDPGELRGARLREHSPKFAAILERLVADKKKSLVYSQFRTVEGIGILELVLRANGFSRFTLDSSGAPVFDDLTKPQFVTFDSSDASKNLVYLYNGELDRVPPALRKFARAAKPTFRVLFVTQSGSEGINLKEVRAVHITEPYWNEIRIQQVIGRGARVGSHSKLRAKDRVIDVYRYFAVVPAKQDNFTIRNVDKNLSTDQIVNAGAQDKMTLVNAFLEALRQSAIDCAADCYEFDKALAPGTHVRDVPLPKRMHVLERAGRRVLNDPESDTDYAYEEWEKSGKLVKVA